MGVVELPVDGAWAIGFVLAITRAAAFALASPLFGRSLPATARLAFTAALSLALTRPVVGLTEVGELVTAGVVNAVIGAALGYVTGLILHLFATAGGIIDLISGLAVSQVFDPLMGDQGGIFGRMFHLVGMTLFVVLGGLGLLVGGLLASVRVLPLDATLAPSPGLTGLVVSLVTQMVRAGVELALPIMGVLLMLELALGLAARFAPQANVFLLGLPAKLLAAITVVGSSWVLFPDTMADVESTVARSVQAVLTGLGGVPPA
jgi:flagellar biosynthesis protein FliR